MLIDCFYQETLVMQLHLPNKKHATGLLASISLHQNVWQSTRAAPTSGNSGELLIKAEDENKDKILKSKW